MRGYLPTWGGDWRRVSLAAGSAAVAPFSCVVLGTPGIGSSRPIYTSSVSIPRSAVSYDHNPSILGFMGPFGLARTGGGYAMATRSFPCLARIASGSYTLGAVVGPQEGTGVLITAPTYSQPFELISAPLSITTTSGTNIYVAWVNLIEPDGVFASSTTATQGPVAAGGTLTIIPGGPPGATTQYNRASLGGSYNLTLQAAGVWDIFFSASIIGDGSRGDNLIVALQASAGDVVAGSGLRTHDTQNDGYDSALNTTENVAFASTISCPCNTDVGFYNAGSASFTIIRTNVLCRQVNTYRHPFV